MTLNYNGGIHDIFIVKNNARYDRSTHPWIFNSIDSVEVKVSNDGIAQGKIHFTPSFQDAIRILRSGLLGLGVSSTAQKPDDEGASGSSVDVKASAISDKVSAPTLNSAVNNQGDPLMTTIVSVRFLYPGQKDGGAEASTPWFSMMLGAPDLTINGNEISFTMNAFASGIIAKSVNYQANYTGQTVRSVVESLAQMFNYEVAFEANDSKTIEILTKNTVKGSFNLSPFNLIKKLLSDVDCYFYFASGEGAAPKDKLMIKSRESVHSSVPDYTFVAFKQIKPAERVIPVYDLQLESTGSMFLKGAAFGGTQEGIDSLTKKPISNKTDAKSDKAQKLGGSTGAGSGAIPSPSGQGAGSSPGAKTPEGSAKLTGTNSVGLSSSDASNKLAAANDTIRKGTLGNKYRITCPGLPNLFPARVVRVEIADIPELTGLGTVFEVTHRSGGDSWVTEFEFNHSTAVIQNGTKTAQTAPKTQDPSVITVKEKTIS